MNEENTPTTKEDELKTCGKCGCSYEGYTYVVTNDFTALVDNATIKREYGNVCKDCRREEADPSGWGVFGQEAE